MWLNLNSDGTKINLKITCYSASEKSYPWTKTSLHVSFDKIINYSIDDAEILENADLENLRDTLFVALNHQLKSPKSIYFAEPDLEFTIEPNIMELKIIFWHKGCATGNGIFISFNQEEMQHFYLYLSLVTREIDCTNPNVVSLVQSGILC